MTDILDDFSALHNLKQREGLNPTNARNIQPYLDECEFRRKLRAAIEAMTIRQASKESGLGTFTIRELVEGKVLDLGVRALREAADILEKDGLVPCLKYLETA